MFFGDIYRIIITLFSINDILQVLETVRKQ